MFGVNINEQNKKKMREQVVPIFGLLEGKKQVIGTAFIIKQGLIITAAHTFYNEIKDRCLVNSAIRKDEQFEIEVNSEKFILGAPVYERYSWDYKTIDDETYHDLSIFKMPEGLSLRSGFELTHNTELEESVLMKGYPHSTNELESIRSAVYNENSSTRTYQKKPLIRKMFTNCFQLQENSPSGMSGGPVHFQNEVFGMIVYGPTSCGSIGGCTATKSDYIQRILNKIVY